MILEINFKELAEKQGGVLESDTYGIFYEHKEILDSLVRIVLSEGEDLRNFTENAKAIFEENYNILLAMIKDLNLKTNKRLENETFKIFFPEHREIADSLLVMGLDSIGKACVLTNENWFEEIGTDKEFEEYYLDKTELEEIPFIEYIESLLLLTVLLEKGIEKCNNKN